MSVVAPPLVGDLSPIAETLPLGRAVGSLWRRLVAFAIDVIIVALAGIAVTLPFFETLSRLGSWGPLVGFFLGLPACPRGRFVISPGYVEL